MAAIPQLGPREAQALLQGSKAVLLDVREGWEYEQVHVEGSLHIPMAEVPERLAELNSARSYVVICHHGNRSQTVAQFLASKGYAQVSNLRGGIEAWAEELEPDMPRY